MPCHPGWTTDQTIGCSLLLLSLPCCCTCPIRRWLFGLMATYWPFASLDPSSSHPPSVFHHDVVAGCLACFLQSGPKGPSPYFKVQEGGQSNRVVVIFQGSSFAFSNAVGIPLCDGGECSSIHLALPLGIRTKDMYVLSNFM